MMEVIIFKACRFARGVPVVVAAVLLCLGVLLSLFVVSGSEGSSALGMANVLCVDQGANGNAPPQDGTSLFFAPAEEATDDRPVNTELLTMLFLAASFFRLTARGFSATLKAKEHCAPPWASLVRWWVAPVRTTYPF
jgi:hypothetical protein